MEDNDFNTEQVVAAPPAPFVKPINIYAVFGISFITSVLVAAVIGLTTLVVSGTDSYYNATSQLVGVACFVLVAVLALGIPVLVGLKFGWRTVVTALIMEAILLFVVAAGFAIFGPTEDPTYNYSDAINSGPSIAD